MYDTAFAEACARALDRFGILALRAYTRTPPRGHVSRDATSIRGVARPTNRRKDMSSFAQFVQLAPRTRRQWFVETLLALRALLAPR